MRGFRIASSYGRGICSSTNGGRRELGMLRAPPERKAKVKVNIRVNVKNLLGAGAGVELKLGERCADWEVELELMLNAGGARGNESWAERGARASGVSRRDASCACAP